MAPERNQNITHEEEAVDLAKEQQRLMENLFKNYDINVRPVKDGRNNVTIRIVPSVRQIVEIVSNYMFHTIICFIA